MDMKEPDWRKASSSGESQGNCVEVAVTEIKNPEFLWTSMWFGPRPSWPHAHDFLISDGPG
jgi:hypothetical protein